MATVSGVEEKEITQRKSVEPVAVSVTSAKKTGHFATACVAKASHEIEEEDDCAENLSEEYYLGEVNSISNDFWSADINVNRKLTQFKLDSGSKITVIGEKTPWVKQMSLDKCTSEFRGPGGVKLSHLVIGKITDAELHIGDKRCTETVYVMENQSKNLLSKSAIQALGLLKPDPVVYNVETAINFRM